MAWTAPATWSVNEIVTASKMNTHVRDNLTYLKGGAGTIAFDAAATFAGALQATDASINHQVELIGNGSNHSYIGNHSAANLLLLSTNRNPSTAAFDNTAKSHAELRLNGDGTASQMTFATAAAANTAATIRMTLDGSGRLGIGTTSPQGRIHTYDSISGLVKYEFDGVDGTARTIIPDAAGDVLYGVMPIWAVRASDGNTQGGAYSTGGTVLLTPGASMAIYSAAGPNTLTLAVSAAGAVTVQRTAGALTYKVSLLLHWL